MIIQACRQNVWVIMCGKEHLVAHLFHITVSLLWKLFLLLYWKKLASFSYHVLVSVCEAIPNYQQGNEESSCRGPTTVKGKAQPHLTPRHPNPNAHHLCPNILGCRSFNLPLSIHTFPRYIHIILDRNSKEVCKQLQHALWQNLWDSL